MNEPFNFQQLTQFEFGALVLSVLVAGLVIGSLVAYWLLKRSGGPESAQTRKVRQEFEDYKEKVDEHFNQTSEMFKDVTTEYKKLYDHMASSAVELCNTDLSIMPRLEMQESLGESESVDKPESDEPEQTADEPVSDKPKPIDEPDPDDQAEQTESKENPEPSTNADESSSKPK